MAKRTETVEFEFTGDARNLVSEARKAARALGETEDSAEDLNRKFEKGKRVADAFGGRVGEVAGRIEHLGRAFGPAGLAVGAFVAATGLAAVGAVKLTRALGDIVAEADAMAARGVGLDEEHIAIIESANSSLDRLADTARRAAVEFGAESGLAGAVDDSAFALSRLVELGAEQSLQALAFGASEMAKSLPLAAAAFALLADSNERLTVDSDRVAQVMASAEAEVEAWEAAERAKIAAHELGNRTRAELDEFELDRAAAREAERTKLVLAAERERQLGLERSWDEAQAQREAMWAREVEGMALLAEQRAAFNASLLETEVSLNATMTELDEALAQSRKELMDERLWMALTIADGIADTASSLFGLLSDLERQNNTAHTKSQRQLFRERKAADLAKATTATALSVATSIAANGGVPAGIPFGVIAGAMGGVQIAKIAATRPSFHLGSRAGDLAPDEMSATLTRRETVLTAQGAEAASALTEANSGIAQGPVIHIVNQYQHDRVTRKFLSDASGAQQIGRVGRRDGL